jgi:hypothetical protein
MGLYLYTGLYFLFKTVHKILIDIALHTICPPLAGVRGWTRCPFLQESHCLQKLRGIFYFRSVKHS